MILHAVERGEGPPLVLLHGLYGQSLNFGAVQRQLATGRRVIALDLRNHGQSPRAPVMGYHAMAEDVLETLRGLGALPAALARTAQSLWLVGGAAHTQWRAGG